MTKDKSALKLKLAGVLPHLNEKQRRILAAAEAHALGYGRIQQISEITGISRPTLYRGLKDLEEADDKAVDISRVRGPGGGRKNMSDEQPELLVALEELIEPSTRGDPESPLRWTCKIVLFSNRSIAEDLEVSSYTSIKNLPKKSAQPFSR